LWELVKTATRRLPEAILAGAFTTMVPVREDAPTTWLLEEETKVPGTAYTSYGAT
jgi:hypothetical protein